MKRLGRPSKYKPEFCKAVDAYLLTTGSDKKSLPIIEGFAIHLDVHKDTIYEWAKLYPDFSDAINKILKAQAKQLVNDGIYGGKDINPSIVKLLLQNNHGMREKQDVTSDGEAFQVIVGVPRPDNE